MIDDPRAADVDQDGAPLHPRDLRRADQSMRLRRQRRGNHEDVGPASSVSSASGGRISFTPGTASRRARRRRATTCMPNAFASRAISEPMVPTPIKPSVRPLNSHGSAIAEELVLRPAPVALRLEHERQLLGERQHDRHHVLGDRRRLHAARVADDDAAREELGQRERLDRDGGGVQPAQTRRRRELAGRQNPRERDVAVGEPPRARLRIGRVHERDLREALAKRVDALGRESARREPAAESKREPSS